VTAYGGTATAMTVTVPGAHLVELLQLDPLPQTTAAADANVIGAWVRVTVEDLERTMRLYRDAFGLPFTEVAVTSAAFGNLIGENSGARKCAWRRRHCRARTCGSNSWKSPASVVIASRHASRIPARHDCS
jgi:hypothetical protein